MSPERQRKPELYRPLPLERIGARGLDITVEANAEERAAIAERLLLAGIHSLRCEFALTHGPGGIVLARGRLQARVEETCVVSLDEFEATVDDGFGLRFVPAGSESDDPDPESEDEVPYAGDALDLGEAAVEQLALALDPYPRKPDAELPVAEAETPTHPFAGLAPLRRLD
ncbi:MAG TPA: DUF177 domain-containing protein [Acetobacteraceae bacterium]|nr:DUF177 domain-containing protein [Acetobacteraceae bacterium]